MMKKNFLVKFILFCSALLLSVGATLHEGEDKTLEDESTTPTALELNSLGGRRHLVIPHAKVTAGAKPKPILSIPKPRLIDFPVANAGILKKISALEKPDSRLLKLTVTNEKVDEKKLTLANRRLTVNVPSEDVSNAVLHNLKISLVPTLTHLRRKTRRLDAVCGILDVELCVAKHIIPNIRSALLSSFGYKVIGHISNPVQTPLGFLSNVNPTQYRCFYPDIINRFNPFSGPEPLKFKPRQCVESALMLQDRWLIPSDFSPVATCLSCTLFLINRSDKYVYAFRETVLSGVLFLERACGPYGGSIYMVGYDGYFQLVTTAGISPDCLSHQLSSMPFPHGI